MASVLKHRQAVSLPPLSPEETRSTTAARNSYEYRDLSAPTENRTGNSNPRRLVDPVTFCFWLRLFSDFRRGSFIRRTSAAQTDTSSPDYYSTTRLFPKPHARRTHLCDPLTTPRRRFAALPPCRAASAASAIKRAALARDFARRRRRRLRVLWNEPRRCRWGRQAVYPGVHLRKHVHGLRGRYEMAQRGPREDGQWRSRRSGGGAPADGHDYARFIRAGAAAAMAGGGGVVERTGSGGEAKAERRRTAAAAMEAAC